MLLLLIGRKGRGREGGGEGDVVCKRAKYYYYYNELGRGVKSDEIFFDSVTSSCRQVPEGKRYDIPFLPSY